MADILKAKFMEDMTEIISNMYRLGWDERNGGNVSYMLSEDMLAPYSDSLKATRTFQTGFYTP